MRNNTQPTLETIQQFHDLRGDLWCVQIYYPKGKKDDRYWIITISYVGCPDEQSIKCATMNQYDYEVRKLTRGQQVLFG